MITHGLYFFFGERFASSSTESASIIASSLRLAVRKCASGLRLQIRHSTTVASSMAVQERGSSKEVKIFSLYCP